MSASTENTPNAPIKRKKLGELLVQAKLIDRKTLDNVLEIQKFQKKKIGQILVDLGVIDDEMIAKALARQLKIPLLRLNDVQTLGFRLMKHTKRHEAASRGNLQRSQKTGVGLQI